MKVFVQPLVMGSMFFHFTSSQIAPVYEFMIVYKVM